MCRIQEPLEESILCYREMLSVYARIRETIASGGSSEVLESLLATMQALSRKAQHADARFQEAFLEAGAFPGKMSLLSGWKSLVNQVREENLQIQQYVTAAMAVIQEDLCRINKGKQALSGYRSGNDDRGRKINVFTG